MHFILFILMAYADTVRNNAMMNILINLIYVVDSIKSINQIHLLDFTVVCNKKLFLRICPQGSVQCQGFPEFDHFLEHSGIVLKF